MNAIAYCRVSTLDQANEGVSLEMQQKALEGYCQIHGHKVKKVIIDAGISGTKSNRPGFQELLEMARTKSVDLVAVYSLSRFARSTKDTLLAVEQFEKNGVSFVSLKENLDTTGAMGKFTLTILAALAQLERDQTSERTKDALATKKARMQRIGTIPFGYRLSIDGTTLEEEQSEKDILQAVQAMRAKGMTFKQIAHKAKQNDWRNRRGNHWSTQGLHHLSKQAA